jgi:hypothetical protein
VIAQVFPAFASKFCKGLRFFPKKPDSVEARRQDAAVAEIRFPKFGIAALVPIVREPGGLVPRAGWFVTGAAFGRDARRQEPRRRQEASRRAWRKRWRKSSAIGA